MSVDIKVLGLGCFRCGQLYAAAEKAITQSGVPATLSKVEDINEIMAYKIRAIPALVINGKVKTAGRIPEASEIITFMETAALAESVAFPR